jgi:hypothetical protein
MGQAAQAVPQNVQLTGNETLNGADTFVYTFDLQDPATIMGGRVWVGASDGPPQKAHAACPVCGISFDTSLAHEMACPCTSRRRCPRRK